MSASDRSSPAAESPVTDEPDKAEDTDGAAGPGTADTIGKAGAAGTADEVAETAGTGEPDALDADGELGEDDEDGELGEDGELDEDDGPVEDEEPDPADGMTPKQARRLRVTAASVLLVVMGVVLVIRLASRTSVLVVGVYGLAMILCGIVIELSRNGRTRLATWLLVGGLAVALALDWLVLP
ncbi:hypothetical protein ACFVU3_35490 [Streptomyces sp. NPDC058052]|uniref:hypothetical protein n=1 Tax=Streptomyces sp. NPDC058052 TaxID=3346316 RepID=UPI0036E5DD82